MFVINQEIPDNSHLITLNVHLISELQVWYSKQTNSKLSLDSFQQFNRFYHSLLHNLFIESLASLATGSLTTHKKNGLENLQQKISFFFRKSLIFHLKSISKNSHTILRKQNPKINIGPMGAMG